MAGEEGGSGGGQGVESSLEALLDALELQKQWQRRQEELLAEILARLGGNGYEPSKASAAAVPLVEFDTADTEDDGKDDEVCVRASSSNPHLDAFDPIGVVSTSALYINVDDCTKGPVPLPFQGTWRDTQGSFYGGSTIVIDADTWQPSAPKLTAQKTATFVLETKSDEEEITLIELRLDGSQRAFVARYVKTDSIAIYLKADPSLKWTLVRTGRASMQERRVSPLAEGFNSSGSVLQMQAPSRIQAWILALIRNRNFDLFIGFIILMNSICIGLQITYELGPHGMPSASGSPIWLDVVEHIFLTIYVLELMLNVIGFGIRRCLNDRWLIFDFVLIFLGVIYAWIFMPLRERGGALESLEQVMVFRLLRLLRLLRAVRGMRQVRTAWRLVTGLLTSMNTMVSTFGLLCVLIFLFACIGVEIITKDQYLWEQEPDILQEQFSTLELTISTLFQFVTLDSISAIYVPLLVAKPRLILFFTPIFLIISIGLMNLVTAVIVESALDRANEDKELALLVARQHAQTLRPTVEKFFHVLDQNGRGYIQMEDLHDVRLSDLPKDLQPHIKVDTMEDLYRLLDVDSSGIVDERTFVHGILGLAVDYSGKASIETILMLKVLKLVTALAKANNIALEVSYKSTALPKFAQPGNPAGATRCFTPGIPAGATRSFPSSETTAWKSQRSAVVTL